jgi:hypothetical protein
MKQKITGPAIKKLCDEYLVPGMLAESRRLMMEHIQQYHQGGRGVNVKVGGLDLNIRENEEKR